MPVGSVSRIVGANSAEALHAPKHLHVFERSAINRRGAEGTPETGSGFELPVLAKTYPGPLLRRIGHRRLDPLSQTCLSLAVWVDSD